MNTQSNPGQSKEAQRTDRWLRLAGGLLTFLFLLWAWEAGRSVFVETEPAFFASHGVWILFPLVLLGTWRSAVRLRLPQSPLSLLKLEVGLWVLCTLSTGLHLYVTFGARGAGSAFVEETLFRALSSTSWFAVYLLGLNAAAFVAGMGLHRTLCHFWQAGDPRSRVFLSVASGFMVWVLAIDTLSRYVSGAPLW